MIQANHKVEQLAAGRLRKHDAEDDRLVLIKVN
jgi:hypothetical protein